MMAGSSPQRPAASTAPAAPPARSQPPAEREIEIKFRADRAVLQSVLGAKLLQDQRPGPARELVSTYFDTAERSLHGAGFVLRLRRKGRTTPLLGVKWAAEESGDVFARGEIEVRAPLGQPDTGLFAPAIRDRLREIVADRELEPMFETRFKRRSLVLRHGGSEIELALDDGSISAGEARLPFAEVELELKSGTAADLVSCARALALACGLSLQPEAKSGRGFRLLEGAAARPQKAKPVAIAPAASFDDLMSAVIGNSLEHFLANWASLRESDAPESIHQLRVALRRMRSALGVFRRVIRLPELEGIRAEARRIASALGPARECDAFRQNALTGPFSGGPDTVTGAMALLDAVEARRRESYVAARAVIEDPATTLFVLDVQNFLARRAWRTALAPEELGLLTSEGRLFAAGVLDRLRKRVLKRGKELPDMPDAERHELRIALKNLRYAAEFFGGLFNAGKDLKAFLKLLAELQDDLGAHNDAVTAEAFVETLGLSADTDARFAAGFLLGYYRHATLVADSHLVGKWKDFRRAGTFWDKP